jgi:hypothetical protein
MHLHTTLHTSPILPLNFVHLTTTKLPEVAFLLETWEAGGGENGKWNPGRGKDLVPNNWDIGPVVKEKGQRKSRKN